MYEFWIKFYCFRVIIILFSFIAGMNVENNLISDNFFSKINRNDVRVWLIICLLNWLPYPYFNYMMYTNKQQNDFRLEGTGFAYTLFLLVLALTTAAPTFNCFEYGVLYISLSSNEISVPFGDA